MSQENERKSLSPQLLPTTLEADRPCHSLALNQAPEIVLGPIWNLVVLHRALTFAI